MKFQSSARAVKCGDYACTIAVIVLTVRWLLCLVHGKLGYLNIVLVPFRVYFLHKVVSIKSGSEAKWSEIGRTEVVANNLSPKFVTLVPTVRQSVKCARTNTLHLGAVLILLLLLLLLCVV